MARLQDIGNFDAVSYEFNTISMEIATAFRSLTDVLFSGIRSWVDRSYNDAIRI